MDELTASQQRSVPGALRLSIVAGAIGLLLLVTGNIIGVVAVTIAGVAGGCVSLFAALYWRSELIDAWRRERRPEAVRRKP